jgi:chromosome segregation ATPase
MNIHSKLLMILFTCSCCEVINASSEGESEDDSLGLVSTRQSKNVSPVLPQVPAIDKKPNGEGGWYNLASLYEAIPYLYSPKSKHDTARNPEEPPLESDWMAIDGNIVDLDQTLKAAEKEEKPEAQVLPLVDSEDFKAQEKKKLLIQATIQAALEKRAEIKEESLRVQKINRVLEEQLEFEKQNVIKAQAATEEIDSQLKEAQQEAIAEKERAQSVIFELKAQVEREDLRRRRKKQQIAELKEQLQRSNLQVAELNSQLQAAQASLESQNQRISKEESYNFKFYCKLTGASRDIPYRGDVKMTQASANLIKNALPLGVLFERMEN